MVDKIWNWQQEDWPNFSYSKKNLEPLEMAYLKASGVSFGIMESLSKEDRSNLAVELICDEAIKTSPTSINKGRYRASSFS